MFQPHRGEMDLRYSQILRAVGAYVERTHLAEIRILEMDDGLILQGRVTEGDEAGARATFQLTKEDLRDLLYDAYAQRGKKM